MTILERRINKAAVRQAALGAFAVCALLALSGLLPTQAAGAADIQISIENFTFNPDTVTIPVGSTVTWTNKDDEPHTVTSSENVFTSLGLDTDETFSHTFATPGTYTYYCKLHPHMTGTIVVK